MKRLLRPGWLRIIILALLLFAAASILTFTSAVQSIDNAFYDSLLRSIKSTPASDIVIVEIDEASLAKLGRWPWSRRVHAHLIDKLTEADVKAVGFNLIFAEPDMNDGADDAFIKAAKNNTHVVLAATYVAGKTEGTLRLTEQLPGFVEASAAVGHTDIGIENGVVRGVYLAAGIDSANLPAFALALQQVIQPFSPVELVGDRRPKTNGVTNGHWVRDFNVLIPFVGDANSFARYSYIGVLNGNVDLSVFRDKTVLVGVTAVGLADQFVTPMGLHGGLMPGVELHANLLQAIRSDRVITPMPTTLNALICFIWLLFAVLMYPRANARQAVILVITLIVVPIVFCVFMLLVLMVWFAPAVTLVCVVLSYLLWTAFRLERVVAELFSEREHSRVILNSIGDGVIAVDANGCVDFINVAAKKMIFKPLESTKGLAVNTIFNITDSKHQETFNSAFKKCLDSSEIVRINEGLTVEAPERTLIAMVTFAPLFTVDGGIMGAVIGFSDVTDNIKTSQQLAFQATHDSLTKLPNRSLLSDRLELAIKRAQRSNHIIAVLFIDLDRFKNINDALGHASGDELLKAVAERFQSAARQGDTVARLGGDEFVILLEGMTEMNAIASVAYKILALAEAPYNIDGHELFVGSSIGISTFPKDGLSASILLKYADVAMYQAKAYGRNGVQFYSHEMNYRTLEHLEIEKDLRYALQNGELELYYQPQIDASSGLIVGVEALLRWLKNGEIVHTPDEFISVAEDSGFIHMLGEWVLKAACEQSSVWRKMGLPTLSIAINVSPRQLFNREFLCTLVDILQSTEMDAEYLEIEITEQTIMSDMAHAAELLNEIRRIGCTVSIDDFGTGYSSLSYLKKLPVNTLKIDQSFVRDIVDNDEDRAITEAIVTMGHGLGMRVVAEGVETRSQMDVLAAQACDVFQGYYLSTPLSAVAMTEYMRLCDAGGLLYWHVAD